MSGVVCLSSLVPSLPQSWLIAPTFAQTLPRPRHAHNAFSLFSLWQSPFNLKPTGNTLDYSQNFCSTSSPPPDASDQAGRFVVFSVSTESNIYFQYGPGYIILKGSNRLLC